MNIHAKTILITGASSGIGSATAKAMASEHVRVILLARNAERLEAVAAEIRKAGSNALVYSVDLSNAEDVERTARTLIARDCIPDIIINNAGAGRWLTAQETSPAEVEQMTAVPYFAAFNITRAFLPSMLKRGSGHIVNVTSVASKLIWPGAAAYTAARWALYGFSKSLEAELYGTPIKITTAVFGSVESPYWEHNPGSRERLPGMNTFIPFLTLEQTARAVVRGIEKDSREIVKPGIFRLIFLLNALFPGTSGRLMRIGWR